MRKVYHGSTEVIAKPLCRVGRKNLDFGQGFYVTDMEQQAVSWATRAVNFGLPQWLNCYELNDTLVSQHATKIFTTYNEEWLTFIVESRNGQKPWKDYDYIEGGVADDRVINTIEDFLNGDISIVFALKRLAEHQPNNQICILRQELLDSCLHFTKAIPLNDLARKEI